MSEIQSIAQNNYILTTKQEVSHDNTLSGNGTVDSPLGLSVSNAWINVSNEFSATTALTNTSLKVAYNPYLGMVQVAGSFYVGTKSSATIYNAPTKYKPILGIEFNDNGRYYDFKIDTGTNNFLIARDGAACWCSINVTYVCNNTATN